MWVLMYVFSYSVSPAATNDRAEWRVVPTLVFQEFSSENRCKAAKATLEGSLKEAGARLRSGLEDLKSLGKAEPGADHRYLQCGMPSEMNPAWLACGSSYCGHLGRGTTGQH